MDKKIFTLLMVFISLMKISSGAIYYVNYTMADNNGDGLSWATAKKDVQNALNLAISGDQVWVKQGTYYPNMDEVFNSSPANERTKTFLINPGISLYGGFAGTETSLLLRNYKTNITTLSGDIGTPLVNTDNCYTVVCMVAGTLDGFVVEGGNSIGASDRTIGVNSKSGGSGSGVSTFGTGNTSIRNNVIHNNTASEGAGIHTQSNFWSVENNIIRNNTATSGGGGMFTEAGPGGAQNATNFNRITNNVFYSNTANKGGAIFAYAFKYGQLINNSFVNNTANVNGGAIMYRNSQNMTTNNNIFYDNKIGTANYIVGADFINEAFQPPSHASFKNNSVQLISTNYPTNNDISVPGIGLNASGNIFAMNPLFINASSLAGIDATNFTSDDGLNLQSTSPCINNGFQVNAPTNDVTGESRTTAGINGCKTDIGAYEAPHAFVACIPAYGTLDITILAGQSYTYNGSTYTASGIYPNADTLATVECCDSIISLNLVVLPCLTTFGTINQSICQGSSFTFNAQALTAGGTYLDTLVNAGGCDSIVTLNLSVTIPNTGSSSVSAYGSYIFNNTTYTTDGTYTGIFINSEGCDSVHTLNLTIIPIPPASVTTTNSQTGALADYTFTYTTHQAVGPGSPNVFLFWHYNGFTIPANYPDYVAIDPLTSANLSISINGSPVSLTNFIATFSWNTGIQIVTLFYPIPAGSLIEITAYNIITNPTISGTYNLSWRTSDGQGNNANWFYANTTVINTCSTTYGTINQSICQGSSYTFDGQSLTAAGTYYDTLINAGGCDSMLTLNLSVNPLPVVTASNISACPGSAVTLLGTPAGGTWDLPNPYTGGDIPYNYYYTDANGCTNSASGNITFLMAIIANLNVIDILGVSAKATWTGVNGIGWFEVRFKATASSTWITSTTGAFSSKVLNGLTPNTSYEVQARGYCSATNIGPWSSSVTFTTNNVCGVPTGLVATNITGTTAKLNWTTTGAGFYTIRYKKTSVSTWSTPTTSTGTNKPVAGLSLNTNYEFQVRSTCGSSSSAYSLSAYFTTAASRNFVVELNENSAEVNIYPNPTHQELHIDFNALENGMSVIKIVDMSGRVVKQIQTETAIGANQIMMDVNELANGIYTVQLFNNEQKLTVKRIIKE